MDELRDLNSADDDWAGATKEPGIQRFCVTFLCIGPIQESDEREQRLGIKPVRHGTKSLRTFCCNVMQTFVVRCMGLFA